MCKDTRISSECGIRDHMENTWPQSRDVYLRFDWSERLISRVISQQNRTRSISPSRLVGHKKVSDFMFTRNDLVAIPSDESNSSDEIASCKRALRHLW